MWRPAAGRVADAAGAGFLPEQEDLEGSDPTPQVWEEHLPGAQNASFAGALPSFPLTPYLTPDVDRACSVWAIKSRVQRRESVTGAVTCHREPCYTLGAALLGVISESDTPPARCGCCGSIRDHDPLPPPDLHPRRHDAHVLSRRPRISSTAVVARPCLCAVVHVRPRTVPLCRSIPSARTRLRFRRSSAGWRWPRLRWGWPWSMPRSFSAGSLLPATTAPTTPVAGGLRKGLRRDRGFNLRFSPRGEAKCVRGPSGRGARRLARAGVLVSTLSTASKRNEVMAVVSRASAVRW